MSCIIYIVSCNFAIHAPCSLALMAYRYNELQVSFVTQTLSCNANCKTPFFSMFINFHESLTLKRCLCVTLLCEKKREEHGRKLYLSLCNEEWLKIVWILMFLHGVFYLECDKGKESRSYYVYLKFCYFYVWVLIFFYKIIILHVLYSSFGIENALCYKMIIVTKRQQQGRSH
jgi:hypothetical protein